MLSSASYEFTLDSFPLLASSYVAQIAPFSAQHGTCDDARHHPTHRAADTVSETLLAAAVVQA
jgi:hypothetical protein